MKWRGIMGVVVFIVEQSLMKSYFSLPRQKCSQTGGLMRYFCSHFHILMQKRYIKYLIITNHFAAPLPLSMDHRFVIKFNTTDVAGFVFGLPWIFFPVSFNCDNVIAIFTYMETSHTCVVFLYGMQFMVKNTMIVV